MSAVASGFQALDKVAQGAHWPRRIFPGRPGPHIPLPNGYRSIERTGTPQTTRSK